jgi:hypothetical protein
LDLAQRLSIIDTLVRDNFCIRNEIVSKGMRKLSEILAVEANVKHVKRVIVIEMWNVRYVACYGIVVVYTLAANPILIVLGLRFFFTSL